MGWSGGGMVTFLVLRVLYVYVATLQRSLVFLLRYMLLRCRDLWCCCYVVYTKGWGGVGGGGHVNGYFVRYMLLRCRDLWCCCYGVWRKGWGGHVNVPATSYVICG